MNNLLELLAEERAIKIVTRNKNFTTVQPTGEVLRFTPIEDTNSVSYKELQFCALKKTPTITAMLVVTTSMGLMTQHSAIKQRIGGRIIGAFY